MELKVGMYVRTDDNGLSKIMFINNDFLLLNKTPQSTFKRNVLKASNDIIDLIEEHDLLTIEYFSPRYNKRVTRLFEVDFVNSKDVTFLNGKCKLNIFNGKWSNEDIKLKPIIKQILTHEEFENRAYQVDKV